MPWGICKNKPILCVYASMKKKFKVASDEPFICRQCGEPLTKCGPPKKSPSKPKKPPAWHKKAFEPTKQVKDLRADLGLKAIGDDLPLLPDIGLSNERIIDSGLLMAPQNCCGFLWKPDGGFPGPKITYLGTTGFAPCVAFFLYDIAIGVCLVCHFDSDSVEEGPRHCYTVAMDLGWAFLNKVKEIDPVSYFRCYIITGFKPFPSSLEIVEGLKAAYSEIAKGAENSELVPVSRSAAGTAILHVWLGKLYNVQGLDIDLPKTAQLQFKEFKDWTAKNKDCGAILDLRVPLKETAAYPSKYYQS